MREPHDSFGPAMRALNDRQRAFVLTHLARGLDNATAAAGEAGYAQRSHGSRKVHAHRLMHNDKVLAALREESLKMMRASTPDMVRQLGALALNSADERVRLKAIGMVLDRTGMQAMTEHGVTVQHDRRTREELIRELVATLREAGIGRADLLGKNVAAAY